MHFFKTIPLIFHHKRVHKFCKLYLRPSLTIHGTIDYFKLNYESQKVLLYKCTEY